MKEELALADHVKYDVISFTWWARGRRGVLHNVSHQVVLYGSHGDGVILPLPLVNEVTVEAILLGEQQGLTILLLL